MVSTDNNTPTDLRDRLVKGLAALLSIGALLAIGLSHDRVQDASNQIDFAHTHVSEINDQLGTATAMQADMIHILDQMEMEVANAATQEALVLEALATAEVDLEVAISAQLQAEALVMAGFAEIEASTEDGNMETAALLAIRSLNLAYTPDADRVLVNALDNLHTSRLYVGRDLSVPKRTSGITSMVFSQTVHYYCREGLMVRHGCGTLRQRKSFERSHREATQM